MAWHAMFTNVNSYNYSGNYACGHAAFPRLWITGAVAAMGGSDLTLQVILVMATTGIVRATPACDLAWYALLASRSFQTRSRS